jgi:protein TonB
MTQTFKRALLHSLFFHALIIFSLLGLWKFYQPKGLAFTQTQPIEQSYLAYQAPQNSALVAVRMPISSIASQHETIGFKQGSAQHLQVQSHHEPLSLQHAQDIQMPAPVMVQRLLMLVAERIQEHLYYPSIAQNHMEHGESILQFSLLPNGQLTAVKLVTSSGVTALDQAALQAVAQSNPIGLPKDLKITTALTLQLPVHFNM